MNSVIEMKRPTPPKSLNDFLDNVSEDDLIAQLDAPMTATTVATAMPIPPGSGDREPPNFDAGLETNSRLTIIKMFETVPEMGRPFTFYVRRYTGEAYVQAMRTTLAKARKLARDENYDMGEPFKMIVLDIQTKDAIDIVTVTRVPKGKKHSIKLSALARMLSGSQVEGDEEDDC